MTFLRPLILAVLTTAFSTGCTITRYYEVSDINNEIAKTDQQWSQLNNKILQDYKAKKSTYNRLVKTGVDELRAPYSLLRKELGRMKSSQQEFNKETQDFGKLKLSLMKRLKGKSRVEADDPNYAQIQQFRQKSQGILSRVKDIGKDYTQASNSFQKTLSKTKVLSP